MKVGAMKVPVEIEEGMITLTISADKEVASEILRLYRLEDMRLNAIDCQKLFQGRDLLGR